MSDVEKTTSILRIVQEYRPDMQEGELFNIICGKWKGATHCTNSGSKNKISSLLKAGGANYSGIADVWRIPV